MQTSVRSSLFLEQGISSVETAETPVQQKQRRIRIRPTIKMIWGWYSRRCSVNRYSCDERPDVMQWWRIFQTGGPKRPTSCQFDHFLFSASMCEGSLPQREATGQTQCWWKLCQTVYYGSACHPLIYIKWAAEGNLCLQLNTSTPVPPIGHESYSRTVWKCVQVCACNTIQFLAAMKQMSVCGNVVNEFISKHMQWSEFLLLWIAE